MAWDDNLTGENRDIYAALNGLFSSYGLGSFSDKIKNYLIQGYSQDTIAVLLQETPEYKQRFKAIDQRRQKGLPTISPGDYVRLEQEYKNIFRQNGIPASIFDTQAELDNYIANDVSVAEMTDRVNLARQSILSDNPTVRATYQAWYGAGLSEGDAIAMVLAPDKALPELERKARAAALGAASNQQGVGVNQTRAEELANLGVAADQALQGFGQVAEIDRTATGLASRYGLDYSRADAENASLLDNAAAKNKIQKLGQRESAEFAGRGIGDSRSLGKGSY